MRPFQRPHPPIGVAGIGPKSDMLTLAGERGWIPMSINVVTTRGELIDGGSPLGDEGRQRVLDACRAGGSSAYATGSSPGFVTEVLPLALLTLQRTVESVSIQEFADLSQRPSPELLFDLMGFGKSPDTFNPGRAAHLMGEFAPSMRTIAEAAGIVIDGWTSTGEVAVTRQATTIVAGELPVGTVGAQRMSIIGSAGGAEALRFTANWYCTTDIEPAWDLASTGWRLQVRGDSSMDVDVRFPVAVEDLAAVTPAYTANRPVNAVSYVCQAAPGVLRTIDLPPVTPAGNRDMTVRIG